ncbi:uncharacterized protein KY384_006486 [Bacidia gigantensis]|uniref:uncharacterized protein n=1 Tax=Bacidia gigantensis TaxID=2732470 RepID=UPI001D04D94E|nr:uncharacterized protein KY384_006486 [Bacidia gigantensis]KAG8528798.1 hypothetical protein KY384_006486 [Bacidia gigantensis]
MLITTQIVPSTMLLPSRLRKRLNVDSPSFTPSSLAANGNAPVSKALTLSPRTASAAPFKPKSITPVSSVASFSSSPASKPYNPSAPDWVSGEPQEFLPQGFNNLSLDNGSEFSQNDVFGSVHDSASTGALTSVESQQNSYHFGSGINGTQQASYMPSASTSSQLLQHHLYAPLEPYAANIKPFQRTAKDIFIPEDVRLKLQKKNEASLRSFPNSQLPNVEYFHTLTPIEPFYSRNNIPATNPSTVFKAVSDQDGKTYSLRRLHDCPLSRDSEAALAVPSLRSKWSRVHNGNVVTTHLAFNTQVFGDTSIIVVSDFYPDSVTLRDKHSPSNLRNPSRNFGSQISEQLLWNYFVQIANALKAIHSAGLAARSMDARKWLVTDEARIRFNACGLSDILDPTSMPLEELQRLDLQNLGKLVLTLGTTSAPAKTRPLDHFARTYSSRLRSTIDYLQQLGASADSAGTIDDVCSIIATESIEAFDASLRLSDLQEYTLNGQLENGRLFRLICKLNTINERPEYESDTAWRDQGQKAALKLFRDYVFHQVDTNGNPVLDMGHMLACLNKLDVGVDEKITLVTRNEQTALVVSYRELKAAVEGSWGDLVRRSGS